MNKLKAYTQVIENALFGYGKAPIKRGDTSRLIEALDKLFLALDESCSSDALETSDLGYYGLSYALGVYYYMVQDEPSSLNWQHERDRILFDIDSWGEHVFDQAPIDSAEHHIRLAFKRFDEPNVYKGPIVFYEPTDEFYKWIGVKRD
jgi:hypothetical protein